jgi:cobalt/nickel transport system permease protein
VAAVHGLASDLHHDGDGRLHRLSAEAKIVATLVFAAAVVATPREAVWAYAVHAAALAAAATAARLPAAVVLRRLRIELPFVAFAAFLPVLGRAPRLDVLGLSLSEPGLWAAWGIVAKGTLGVGAAVVLGATTSVTELLAGLDRLRVPRLLTSIAGFMVRYLAVIGAEASRMSIARASRGHDPRWLWQARAVASSSGTLFVRAYERGERVHLAMCSRGYDGTMPVLHEHERRRGSWALAGALPAVTVATMLGARLGLG